jgi:hypothetical protein
MQALKILVGGLGALIVLGMITLGWGLYRKANDPDFKLFDLSDTPATNSTARPDGRFGDIVLPGTSGCRITDLKTADGRLFVSTAGEGNCGQIFVINPTTGEVVGTISVGR